MKTISVFLLIFLLVLSAFAQSKKKTTSKNKASKAPIVYKDENGQVITPAEFFESYDMMNPESYQKVIKNGNIAELQLKKNPRENVLLVDFTSTTLDGKLIDTKELRGKVLVINFWFIACSGCVAEFPELNKLQAKYKDNPNVVFLGLTFDSVKATQNFLKKKTFNYQIVADAQKIFDDVFKYDGFFPVNLIIGKDGKIIRWQSGVYVPEKFDDRIQKELEKNY